MPTELPTSEVLPPSKSNRIVDYGDPLQLLPGRDDSYLRRIARDSLPTAGPLVHPLPTSDSGPVDFSFRKHATRQVAPQLVRYDHILSSGDTITSQKHLKRLRECRTRAWFTVHRDTRQVRIASNRCNLRWCPMCQRTKRYIIAEGVIGWLENAKAAKFLTLTLKSSDHTIEYQLKELYAAFRKFRRRQFPAKLIRGGFWFFQVTYNKSTMQWHPHIHCLIDSEFLPQRKLSNAWSNATGGSKIVDIRTVTDAVKSAQYVARYATSPSSLLSLTPVQGWELVLGLRGQRIVGAWGSALGIPLSPRKPEDSGRWVRGWNFSTVMRRRFAEPLFQELYQCWRGGKPYESSFLELDPFGSMPSEALLSPPETHEQLYMEFSGPIVLSPCVSNCQQAPMEY